MKHAFYSTAGRVKPINEDAALLRIASCAHHVRGMLAVCDGVSSLSDSAQASRFVIACLNELFEKWKMQSIRPQKEFPMEQHVHCLCSKMIHIIYSKLVTAEFT